MQFVTTGWTYKFVLKKGFEALDGVYTVVRILTYDELIGDNINLATDLYKLVGKTVADYNQDYRTFDYRNADIYKLVDVTNYTKFYYIPDGLLKEVPNSSVKKYPKLSLGVYLGVFKDADEVAHLKRVISQQISCELGVTRSPDSVVIQDVWLTDDEYSVIEKERESAAKAVVNYYSENIELRRQINDLKELVAAYEKIIVSVSVK